MAIKSSVPMAAHSFLVPIYLISICSDCQLKKLRYLYACWIMHMRHHLQVWKWNAKSGQKSGTQYVGLVTKVSSSYCGAHFVESHCKESNISDTNWLRYLFSSYLIKIWSSVWCHYLVNLHIIFKNWNISGMFKRDV